jgi:transcriptional regulator with XRE-family HTH domain
MNSIPDAEDDRSSSARRQQLRREALRRAGVTQAALAERIGVSRQSVGLVLADHHRSRRVEQAIADAAGMDVAELFPPEVVQAVELASPTDLVHEAADDATLERAGAAPAQIVASPDTPAVEIESRLTAELRRIAEELFLAIAEHALAADRPVVRAAAAALRELGPRVVVGPAGTTERPLR